MHAMLAGRWRGDVLDEHCPEGAALIQVEAWCQVGGALQTRAALPAGAQRVWGYVRKVGVRRVVQKVRSRLQEVDAGERVLGVGVGRVLPCASAAAAGERVIFVATRHHAVQSRVVVPLALVRSSPDGCHLKLTEGHALAGASVYDGRELAGKLARKALDEAHEVLERLARGGRAPRALHAPDGADVCGARGERDPLARATVFGRGHYARTCMMPHVRDAMGIGSVHELSPAMIPAAPGDITWSTSPHPEPQDEGALAWFIAGYHHHHAPLAVQALRRGIAAVVEKPVVVSHAQLDALLEAMRSSQAALFQGFHRRHAAYDAWLRRDLRAGSGASPLDYHAIVHEIPLPPHHWYNWPASGSRLLSNGCHWVDHFLWLNAGAAVVRQRAQRLGSGGIEVSLGLENGASFTLALSERGTSRTGVREVVEVRGEGRMARLVDSAYQAEDRHRVLRRGRVREHETYARMYRKYCARILAGEGGERAQDVERVWRVILELEQELG